MRFALLLALALSLTTVARADDTCPNGASLESAMLLWLFGNPFPTGFGCATLSGPPSCGGHTTQTYICGDGNPSHTQYEVIAPFSCSGSGANLQIHADLYFRTGSTGSFTRYPYPQDTAHCKCGVGCGWQ